MRSYYSRDKKRREDAKRKRKEEKRLRRLNRKSSVESSQQGTGSGPALGDTDAEIPGPEAEE